VNAAVCRYLGFWYHHLLKRFKSTGCDGVPAAILRLPPEQAMIGVPTNPERGRQLLSIAALHACRRGARIIEQSELGGP